MARGPKQLPKSYLQPVFWGLSGSTLPLFLLLRGGVPIPTTLVIVGIVVLFSILRISISRLALAFSLALVSFAALAMTLEVFSLDSRLIYPPRASGIISVGMLFVFFARRIQVKTSHPLETLSWVTSTILLMPIVGKDLFQEGGALAAILHAEDNAAWMYTTNAALINNDSGPGNFGALIDVLLTSSYGLTSVLVRLGFADYLALSVVAIHIFIIGLIPLISNAVLHLTIERPSIFQVSGMSVGAALGFIHFSFIGHLATGIGFVVGCFLIAFISLRLLEGRTFDFTHILTINTTILVITATWFPLAVFSVALTFLLWWLYLSDGSPFRVLVTIISLTVSTFILFREVITRADTFRSDELSIVSGIGNLLRIEGGVGGLEFLSAPSVLILLVGLTALLLIVKAPPTVIAPLAIAWISVVTIRFFNLYFSSGQVNYGSRKFEAFAVLLTFVILILLIQKVLSSNNQKFSEILVFAVSIWFLIQIPSTATFIGGGYYPGIEEPQVRKLSLLISEKLELGKPAVCLYDTYPPEKSTQFSAYLCSRWVASLSDTDGPQLNEWRKVVLGEVDPSRYRSVSSALGRNVTVFPVPPYNPNKELHEVWKVLVQDTWDIVSPSSP